MKTRGFRDLSSLLTFPVAPVQTQVLKVPEPSRKVEELLASQVCFLFLCAFRRQLKES